MKAFIAITLLAACAAAQTFDYRTGLQHQLLRREHGLVNGLYGNNVDTLRNIVDVPRTFNNVFDDVEVLSLNELVRHPLFETYYNLPLFRRHFSHPLFKHFLTTRLFQKYWTVPVFKTLFTNEYLFQKYIYPIVYNTNTVNTGVYNTNTVNTGVYDFGLNVPTTHVQYSHVLDKVLRNLLVKKPEIEVVTDVKIVKDVPVERQTIVDPITGELKYNVDYKNTVDKQVLPIELIKKIWLNKMIYGDRTVDRVIPDIYNVHNVVPRDLYVKDNVDTVIPHDYETIRHFINKYNTVLPREVVDQYQTVYPRDLVTDSVLPRELVNNKYYETLFNKYQTRVPRVHNYDVLNKDFLNTYGTIPRVHNYDVLNKDLLNNYETIPRVHNYDVLNKDLVNKYDVLPKDLFLNRFDTVLPREHNLINKIEKLNLIKKLETENKLENILNKPLVA